MTTTRLNIRISEQLKAKAIKAAVLSGPENLADYVASVMDEHSAEVISQHESFTIGGDAFDRFVCGEVAVRLIHLTPSLL